MVNRADVLGYVTRRVRSSEDEAYFLAGIATGTHVLAVLCGPLVFAGLFLPGGEPGLTSGGIRSLHVSHHFTSSV